MNGYLSVVVYLGFIIAFAIVSLGMAWVLSPSRPFTSKLNTYECGAEPIGGAWVQFPVGFDALAVFLFPWVLVLRTLGARGLVTMVLFLAILGLGWVYSYRERIFEWQ